MVVTLLAIGALSQTTSEPITKTFEVNGLSRKALIYVPKSNSQNSPIIFAFHGHGGSMRSAARSFGFHNVWPEAISVYMEGLPTKTPRDPEGTRNGWEMSGQASQNRDLKFFDVVLASVLKDHQGDPLRVFVTGHSNGGGFTYVLWAERFDVLAGAAPSASVGARNLSKIKPLPAFFIAGKNDEIVAYDRQVRSIEAVLKLNGVKEEFKGESFHFKGGKADVGALIHGGNHQFPDQASKQIAEFFKNKQKG